MDSVGCRLFKVSPHFIDLNPIQNIFHLIAKQLKKNAITQNLDYETYEKFGRRAKTTVMNFPLRRYQQGN